MANDLISRSINPAQLNMANFLQLKGWNTDTEIGLIDWLCGWGKTYLAASTAANGILQKINNEFGLDIQPYETLFLVSRAAIREQTLAKYSDTLREVRDIDELIHDGWIEEPHKIRIATYHKLGGDMEEKAAPTGIRLVICDEFHSVFADTFSSQMFAVKKWLSETPIIRIGLTATPQPLYYLTEARHETQQCCINQFNFKFRNIACHTEPKYRFNQFHVVGASMSIETAFRKYRGTDSSKSIFFTFSARTAAKILKSSKDSLLFISQGNEKQDREGINLVEYMDTEHNEELLATGIVPQGFNNVIATSCFREGVDLHDTSVKTVVVQSYLPHEIIQSLGRFRNDIEDVYILANRASFEVFRKECNSAFEFLQIYRSIQDEDTAQRLLEVKYKEQTQLDNAQWLVNRYGRKYEIDYSIFAYWLYQFESWLAVTNYNGRYAAFLDKEISTRKEFYKNMFDIYTDKLIDYLEWNKTKTRRSLLESRFNSMDEIVEPYLDKKLFADSEEREELVNAIGAIDEYGFSRKWTTVKKWLKTKGYSIQEGREKNKRFSVIHKN